jgi:hypothetical protein
MPTPCLFPVCVCVCVCVCLCVCVCDYRIYTNTTRHTRTHTHTHNHLSGTGPCKLFGRTGRCRDIVEPQDLAEALQSCPFVFARVRQ